MNHFSYTAVIDWEKSVNYNNIKQQKLLKLTERVCKNLKLNFFLSFQRSLRTIIKDTVSQNLLQRQMVAQEKVKF